MKPGPRFPGIGTRLAVLVGRVPAATDAPADQAALAVPHPDPGWGRHYGVANMLNL